MEEIYELASKYLNNGFKIDERLNYHNNSVRFDDYRKKLLKDYSKKMKDKKIIYLDTNYWIKIANCIHKSDIDENNQCFTKLIYSLHSQNKIICPISLAHIIELEKQLNKETFLSTIEIMRKR